MRDQDAQLHQQIHEMAQQCRSELCFRMGKLHEISSLSSSPHWLVNAEHTL